MTQPDRRPNRFIAVIFGLLFVLACVCSFELAVGTGIRSTSEQTYSLVDSLTERAEAVPTYQTPAPAQAPTATPVLSSAPAVTETLAATPTTTLESASVDATLIATTLASAPIELTTEKGSFMFPGSGYMDGRDLWSDPPRTLMVINVWPSVGATITDPVVCELEHGEKVELLEAQQDPASDELVYEFKVRSEGCEGWVSWWFVSDQLQEPIGDQFDPRLSSS